MAQTVVLKVGMSCQGCVGAVTRVLTKLEGVESFDVDIKAQKVTVNTNLEPQVVLEKVSKTGKKTEFWKDEAPAKTEAITAVVKNTESVTVVAETVETAPVTTVAAEAPPATAEPTPTPAAA